MANITHGMNVGEVGRIGGEIKRRAQDITTLIGQLEGLLVQMQENWKGSDSQQFKGRWDSDHKKKLTAIALALGTFGDLAIRNADKQSETSNSL